MPGSSVYYTNSAGKAIAERIAEIERGRHERFSVEIGPLKNYYPAGAYQNYLEKSGRLLPPSGAEMGLFSKLRIDRATIKAAAEAIRDKLTQEQYRVTQESGTERPSATHSGISSKEIYVDIVTSEPLLFLHETSLRKQLQLATTFTKPIESACRGGAGGFGLWNAPHGGRSRAGDSHLGHVFTGDSGPPTACDAASAARPSAFCLTKMEDRAMDIFCICLSPGP